ncbi:MAG: hypothetical protein FWC68_02655 [Oscillospiraceae bacterium]|nr:hypothetical protein [Oscillospiraceae bacterium]
MSELTTGDSGAMKNGETNDWADDLLNESIKQLIDKGQTGPISNDEYTQVYRAISSITSKKFSPRMQIKFLKLDGWRDYEELGDLVVKRVNSLTKEVCLYIAKNSSPRLKIEFINSCSYGIWDENFNYIPPAIHDKEIQEALFSSHSLEVKDHLIYHLFGKGNIEENSNIPIATSSPTTLNGEFDVTQDMSVRIQMYLAFLKHLETVRNDYMEEISRTLKPSMINTNLTGSEFNNAQLEGLFKGLLAHLLDSGDSFNPIDKNSAVGSKFLENYMRTCRYEDIKPESFISENDTTFELTTAAKIAFVQYMKVKSTNLVDLARKLDELTGADKHGLDARLDKVIELAKEHNSSAYFSKCRKSPWGSPYYNTYIVVGDGKRSEAFFVGYDSGKNNPDLTSFVDKFKERGFITQDEIGKANFLAGIRHTNQIDVASSVAPPDNAETHNATAEIEENEDHRG